MWHIWAVVIAFCCVLVQLDRIVRAEGRILQTWWSGVSRLLPTVSRFCWPNTSFLVWISCHMHHTYFVHTPAHPTVNHIRVSMFLLRFMPIVDVCEVKNLKFKFIAYIKGELLYASRLLLYDYQMRYMWVVINHQKGGDWKWSRPLSGFWWLMTKHMYI